MAKPKITRIKAGEGTKEVEEKAEEIKKAKKIGKSEEVRENVKAEKTEKVAKVEKAKKKTKVKNPTKKPFILFRPFVAFFRYLRDSWKEIRQVRWPSRKTTWKMVLAVLVYTALFVVIISLLDLFFTWLFNLILGN